MAGSNSKKPRNPRMGTKRGECTVKTGKAGAKKMNPKLTPIEKILMGKGYFQSMSHKRDEESRKYRASRETTVRRKKPAA